MFLTGLIGGSVPRHLETCLTPGNLFDIIHIFCLFIAFAGRGLVVA